MKSKNAVKFQKVIYPTKKFFANNKILKHGSFLP